MAVEAVVSVVIQKLTDMLKEESIIHDKRIVDELEEISKSLEGMRGFLIDAEDKPQVNQIAKDWAKEYLEVVYKVEDVIEKFALRIACQRKRLGFLMNHALFFNNLNACHKLRRKMKRIRFKIEKLNHKKPKEVQEEEETNSARKMKKLTFSYSCNEEERCIAYKAEERSISCEKRRIVSNREERLQYSKQMSSFSYEEEELGIFGLKEDVDNLVKRLTETGERLVPIVGGVGSGKTTLVRAIYRSSIIKKRFQGRVWVTLSNGSANGDILRWVLEKVEKSTDEGAPIHEQELEEKLCKVLTEKRYLVVLDDVPNCDAWKKLEGAFPDTKDGNGSKIIFITCEASAILTQFCPHELKPLNKQDSWDMFLKKAGKEKSSTSTSETLKQNIVGRCKGLPLNIVLLGGLFSTIEENRWASVQLSGHNSEVWSLSYNNLSAQLKLCLLYLVLFPKNYDIPVRRLLRLWHAEGFVKKSRGMCPEDVVQTYFDDLVLRNLIQISRLRSDNSPRKCHLIGVLHDYLLPKARDISLFYVYCNMNDHTKAAEGPFGIRRLVEYVDIKNFPRENNPPKLRHLRSYLSFNPQKKDTPAKEIGRFIGNGSFGLLRVLDLEGVYKPSLPDKLGDLFHLRYLGLRRTFLDTLPQTVGDLTYLETLDVKHTNLKSLPNSIWKLKHLRHLNLNELRLDMPGQRRCSLTLLTLWGLFVDGKSLLVKNGLNSLCDLRELGISFHLSTQNDLFDWIAKLTDLQSLRLRSKDDMGCPSKLELKPLSKLEKLSHLNLLGNLQRLPFETEFPPNLKVLTLSVSRLNEDPMRILGQLQSLTVLRLLANSYLGDRMDCLGGGFVKLRVLKLWMLKELKEWKVQEGTMANLKELDIRCCDKLNKIPPILLQLKSFEELILTNMPKKLTDEVRQQKPSHTSLTVHTDWKFAHLTWEQDGTSSYRDRECNGDDGPSVMQSVVSDVKPGSSGGSSSTIQLIKGKGKEKILSVQMD